MPEKEHADSPPTPVATMGWNAKQIRDSIQRFLGDDGSALPAHLQRIRKNMNMLWNTDDSVFLTLIVTEKEHIEAFRKYVFDSPLIKIGGGPGRPPKGILVEDTNSFFMRVIPNVYPVSIEQIEIAITNHTDQEGMAGEDQYIEYFDGNAWTGLPQNNFVIDIGYPVFPDETRDDFTATLVPELKKNKPGLYRVYKTISTGVGKDLVKYVLTAPFYLSDNPEEYKEYTRFASNLHEPRPMAEFKGGREALERFFKANLRYPESYKGSGTEVRLFYSFTIDSAGRMRDPISLPENILYPRDTGKTYDEFREEALRVLRLMPPWEPAVNRKHGPVSVGTGLFFIFKEDGCAID